VRRVGSAQHQVLAVEEVHETRVALGELDHQGHDALQNFREAHFPDHEAADLLEQAQLPLGLLQAPSRSLAFGTPPL